MYNIKKNEVTVEEYLYLRDSVGWKKLTDKQAELSLKNCLYRIGVYDGDKIIGMGRIVGDGVVIDYIQDLIVHPDYQGKGVGRLVIEELIRYAEDTRLENSELMLCLMCAKGREPFYKKFDFIARPTDKLGPGMIRYLNDENSTE